MNIEHFRSGTFVSAFQYRYFLPEKINQPYVWSDERLNALLEKASLRLGELNAFSRFVPDTDNFIVMHVLKEAVVSSRIEGTRTNMEEALIDEKSIDPERRDDWQEVNKYVEAMNQAIDQLKELPLSGRLLRDTHRTLMSSVRGEHKQPGEFRQSQNWIGGASLADAVFIPPAHTELPALIADLERFLNNQEVALPHLVRIAMAHYQFETIHPFLDGNGRVGRLLITLYLVANGVLEKPLLYLSAFFEKNKGLYYDNLTFVRTKNDLAQWLKFFLVGIIETAETSTATLKKIIDLKADIERNRILVLGKRTRVGQVLLHELFRRPVMTIREAQTVTGLSPKAAGDLVQAFVDKGILREITGYQRNRNFAFHEYLALFD